MAKTLQVLYPATAGSTFDFDCYTSSHVTLVGTSIGAHVASTVIARGVAGGDGVPAGFHAIATMTFADQASFDAGMAAADPAVGGLYLHAEQVRETVQGYLE